VRSAECGSSLLLRCCLAPCIAARPARAAFASAAARPTTPRRTRAERDVHVRAEVSPEHRALLQAALDVGARYIRTALGREVPPATIYAHTDLEAMIGDFGQHEAEIARRCACPLG
jgi:hypothetical protein